MKNVYLFMLLIVMIGSGMSCEKNDKGIDLPSEPRVIELSAKAPEIISSSNDFGISLFTQTAINEDGNLMLSPLSANIALTMLLNGSDGDTYEQIKGMLGYPEDLNIEDINLIYQNLVKEFLETDSKVSLAIANAIFYKKGFSFKEVFLNKMDTDFDAHVEGLYFEEPDAVEIINQWASDNTNKRIPKVIDDISNDMVMFLMNALYFKGEWTHEFDKAKTNDKSFILDNGNEIQTSTMEGKIKVMLHYGKDYAAMEIPYGRKNFSMIVVIPEGTLKNFYKNFTPGLWDEITTSLDGQGGWNEVLVNLPKFKFDYEKILNDQLKALGMNDAFAPYVANLSGISDEELFVSFVKQNTFVEVNEEGTEAAAVTTTGIEVVSMPPHFFVNKPFIFAIRERTTNTLLFMGGVTNPKE